MYPNHFYSFWAWTIFNLASFVTAFGTGLYHGHEAIRFLGVKNTLLFSQVVVAFVCNGRKRVDVTCAYVLAYSLVYPCSLLAFYLFSTLSLCFFLPSPISY
ncbi:hypothetical protein V2G26_000541 [Clonostachys chloroleuca]